jgi:periplasmic divalent cation tolerance protein
LPDSKYIVILSTAGTLEEASKIAEHLVSNHLVACVNLIPGIQSIYWWNHAVQKEQEVLMIIKTERGKFEEVERAISSLHSYEVPEMISIPVEDGSQKYLQWIDQALEKGIS